MMLQNIARKMAGSAALIAVAASNGHAVLADGHVATNDGDDGAFSFRATSASADFSSTIIQPSAGIVRWFRKTFLNDYPVECFGAVGDGVADDTAAINRTVEACYAAGGGVVSLKAGKNYLVRRRIIGSQVASIGLRPGVSLEGNGATITVNDNCGVIGNIVDQTVRATITADVALTSVQFAVDSTANLAAGDVVGVRLGNNAYDAAETSCFYFARVKSVDSDVLVTLDRPAPQAMAVAATAPRNRAFYRFRLADNNAVYENSFIRNVRVLQGGTGNIENVVGLVCTRNISVSNIYAENPGAGAVLMAYSFNNKVRNVYVPVSTARAGQASKGRVINLWNCENISFFKIRGDCFQGPWCFIEGYSKQILLDGIEVNNNWLLSRGSARISSAIFSVVQNSQVTLRNVAVRGTGTDTTVFDFGGTASDISYKNFSLLTTEKVKSFYLWAWNGGFLELNGRRLHYEDVKRIFTPIHFTSNMVGANPGITLPKSYTLGLWYSGTNLTNVNKVYVVGASKLSINAPVAGTRTRVANSGVFGTDYPFNDGDTKSFALYTGIVDKNATVTFEWFYIPYSDDDMMIACGQDTAASRRR